MDTGSTVRPAPARSASGWRSVAVSFSRTEYTYPYFLGARCTDGVAVEIAAMQPDRVVVVADEHVWHLHGDSLGALRSAVETEVILVPPGERAKRPEVLTSVVSQAIARGATRKSVVVAFGGGAAGNLAGLAAALLFRGLRLVHLPTTTIGAFDSVLSMKQAVNSESGKNQIGTYHCPSAVMVDTSWFETLPPEVARGGWCEAAKNALAIDPTALGSLGQLLDEPDSDRRWDALFEMSLRAKMAVMINDPHERREGLTLEYGHTIGHAIEYVAMRSGATAIAHGDAIVLGMVAAARISCAIGHLSDHAVELHEGVAVQVGAPTRLPPSLDLAEVLALVKSDNKRGLISCGDDEVVMVLLEELGRPITSGGDRVPLISVPIALVEATLAELGAGRS